MAFDSAKPNTSQTIGDVVRSTKDNLNDLDTRQTAHEADVAAHGLDGVNTKLADYDAHKANQTDAHGIDVIIANVATNAGEINDARGAELTLSDRLGVALNADGTIKLQSISSKWIDIGDTPTFLTSTTFKVSNNRTGLYLAGVHLRLTQGGVYYYAPIASSTYSVGPNETTITLDPNYPILVAGLTKAEVGLISYDNNIAAQVASMDATITQLVADFAALGVSNWSYEWLEKSANYTARSGDKIFVDTSAGVVTITMPEGGEKGDTVRIVDVAGNFATNALLVDATGVETVMGSATAMTVDKNNLSLEMVRTSTGDWRVT